MKILVLLFIMLLSFQVSAQVVTHGSGFLGLPNKEERRMNACGRFLEDLSAKTFVYSNARNYCISQQASDLILSKEKFLINCMKKAKQVTGFSSDLLRYCLEDGIMNELADPQLQACVTETGILGFPHDDHNRIQICRNDQSKVLLHDPTFLSCIQFLKIQQPNLGSKNRVLTCLKPDSVAGIDGKNFEDCRTRVTGLGFAPIPAINYCFRVDNQSESKYKQVDVCAKTLNNLLGKELGFKYCLDFKEANQLLDAKNSSCFKETLYALAPGFFDPDPLVEDQSRITTKFKEILADCSSDLGKTKVEPGLRLHGAYYIQSNMVQDNIQIGGLSGITYDSKKNVFHIVSDDPGQRGPSRFLTMRGNFSDGARFTVDATTFLSSASTDAESIQLLDNGHFVISSETLITGAKSLIRIYDQNGKRVDEIPMPKKYKRVTELVSEIPSSFNNNAYQNLYKEILVKGMRDNKGLESLGIPENNRNVIFTSSEAPLIQDQIPNKSIVRIVKISKNDNDAFESEEEFAYQLDNTLNNGISDILPLNENELLVLERRYDPQSDKVSARIYSVNLTGAPRVSEIESFKEEYQTGRNIPVVQKRLLLNFDDVVSSLPAGFRKLDNVEGMTLGPDLGNGTRALVVVTDNNFSDRQLNQIMVFEFPVHR